MVNMGKMGVITIAYELCGLELQNLYLNLCFSSTLSFTKVVNNGKLGE